MSVLEPPTTAASTTGTEIDPPDFPIVVRGYDRHRVNTYLQSLVSRLAAERDRATQAEQAANDQQPTFERLGAEAIKVLELATQSAEVLVEEARKHGESIVEEAEGQAADLLEEARQQAERLHAAARGTLREAADERDRILGKAGEEGKEIRTLAEEDARATLEEAQSASQRMWQTVQDECTAIRAETERLQELRDRTMEHLTHVRTELNSSLFARRPEEEPDAAPVLDAGAQPAVSSDAAEPDSAMAAEAESDQVDGSEEPTAAASAQAPPKPRP
ncbi:MAG TPA: DivIVA domain-containing protein [Actinomycetota bacterium]|nr:DivIVA domain-containing protein [Actinomycetota bacterium]